MTNLRRLTIILYIAVGTVVVGIPSELRAATAIPPNTSAVITPPLNSGPNAQQKSGSLLIGLQSAPAKLCLNASSINDTTNCITSWAQFSSTLGSFVRLTTTTFTVDPGAPSNTYSLGSYQPREIGYADIVARPAQNQAFTTVVKASPIQYCQYASPFDLEGRCINDGVGNPCYTNADCSANATAVYATASGNTNAYSGYFTGRVLVSPTADGQLGRICLGDPTTESACISSWNQLASTPSYVYRYTTGWPASRQTYGARISGNATFGSAVLGDPTGLTAHTCGDGACEVGETAASCAVDCGGVPQPSVTASMHSTSNSTTFIVNLAIVAGAQTPNNVKLYVVRAQNQNPTWRPVDGVSYSSGLVVGNSRLVAVLSTTSGGAVNYLDTLPSSGVFYYQVYQANDFPRYSAPLVTPVRVQPFVLTLIQQPDYNAINIHSGPSYGVDDNQINCGWGPTDCVGVYNLSQVVTLWKAANLSGKAISSWVGCDSFNSTQCINTTTGTESIVMNWYTPSTGGGGEPGCFAADELVDTPFGPKRIQHLRVGDAVYALDEGTGRRVISRVTKTFVHDDRPYGEVLLSDGSRHSVTDNHPYYNAATGTWQAIGTMLPGDRVVSWQNGRPVTLTIVSAEFTSRAGTVYNIEVDGYHNYFVDGVLVHNKFGGGAGG